MNEQVSIPSKIKILAKDLARGGKVRVQKKIRDYLGIFPNMGGGGSSQFPKLKTKKKVPLNHPKITQKTN